MPARILLVDDDITVLDVTEQILNKLGYRVISYTNSVEALSLFTDLPDQFDLIITDYRMPNLNGAQLSKAILKINPQIPIIMCSGYSSEFSRAERKKYGIKWFVRKPLLSKDFAYLVEQVLNGGEENS